MITQSKPLAHQQGWWLIGTVFLKCPLCIASDLGQSVVVAFVAGLPLSDSGGNPFPYPTTSDSVCYKVLVQTFGTSFDRGSVEFSQHTIVGNMVFRQILHNSFFHKTRRIQVKKGNIQALICRILPS